MTVRVLDRLYWTRYRRQYDVDRVEREQAAFEAASPSERRRAMAARLQARLRHFAARPDALPAWRDAASIDDLDAFWRAWPTLPIVTKTDLQGRFSASALRRLGVEGTAAATGGSTGEPTTFIHDAATMQGIGAVTFLARQSLGWKPGQRTICVWGSQRDIGQGLTGWRRLRHAVTNRLSGLIEIDGFTLTDETARRVHERLLTCGGGAAIYGFSSMLEHVAATVQRRGWRVPRGLVSVAWNGGEMLHESQVALFTSVFGVPILDYYGGRELGTIAVQRERGGPRYVARPFVFVELVGDDDRPVEPGRPGRVVVTSTEGCGSPFLRYDIGDVATASADGVDEAGVSRFDALLGRTGSVIRLPGGATVSNNYWNHLFKELAEVRQFQVRLQKDGGVRLSFVGQPFGATREAWLRGVIGDFLGPVPVEISWVESIAPTAMGKRLQVVAD